MNKETPYTPGPWGWTIYILRIGAPFGTPILNFNYFFLYYLY